jgi:Tfp pilus assembly protein PilX
MINMYRNRWQRLRFALSFRRQAGAAILIITVILLVAAVALFIFAATYIRLVTKTAANGYINNQAFEAAEAGLEFGLVYLTQNSSAIQATASGGYVNYGPSDSNITNVTLANNSKFSVVYKNPTANNYSLMLITATGVSADGTTTRVLSQQSEGAGGSSLSYTVTTQGDLITSGSGSVSGTNGIDAGGSIIQSGSWTVSSEKQNDSTLSSESSAALFNNIFGTTQTAMQAKSTQYATQTGVPWSSLSGNVWINSGVVYSGTMTIGTTSNPVALFVNGNFIYSGNLTVNGILYVMGTTTTSGNITVNGAIVSQGAITMSGTGVAFNQTIVNKLTGGSDNYAKIPGSWRDF